MTCSRESCEPITTLNVAAYVTQLANFWLQKVKPQTVCSTRKMANCSKCFYLSISRRVKHHVLQDHFYFEDSRFHSIKPWQAFFKPTICSKDLFYTVENTPRCDLGHIRRSYRRRFVYTIRFNFDVGFYPYMYQRGTTKKIQIVCDLVKCPRCGIRRPTAVRTAYPWDKRCEEELRGRRPYVPRGRRRRRRRR